MLKANSRDKLRGLEMYRFLVNFVYAGQLSLRFVPNPVNFNVPFKLLKLETIETDPFELSNQRT